METARRRCPQCGSEELYEDRLSQAGSVWPVLFGSKLFSKKELLAYACKKCGFVFLFLGSAVKTPDTAR